MNIKELYEGDFLDEAYKRLQSPRDKEGSQSVTKIAAPDFVSDNILINFIAINYISCLDFKPDGTPIMGEIGGIIPENPEDKGKLVLAATHISVGKVIHGIRQIILSEETGDKTIITKLEKEIEMPVEYRNGVTIVNGNRSIAHYDFSTKAAVDNLADMLKTNTYLLLAGEGYNIVTGKCRHAEQYIINIPTNKNLFSMLRNKKEEDKIKILTEQKELILPNGFIAGFRFRYFKYGVQVVPLIPEKEAQAHKEYLEKNNLKPSDSRIAYLGCSDAYGNFGLLRRLIETEK